MALKVTKYVAEDAGKDSIGATFLSMLNREGGSLIQLQMLLMEPVTKCMVLCLMLGY